MPRNLPVLIFCISLSFFVSLKADAVTVQSPLDRDIIPLELQYKKFYLSVSLNGQNHKLILDTGSPTLLTRSLANTLGLTLSGTNVGQDANGQSVTSCKAILSNLKIGEFNFRDVPVLVFDDSAIGASRCALGGGVIGSEILPLLNWQFDLQAKQLTLSKHDVELPLSGDAKAIKLYDFGYPHAPIIDYQIGKLKDKLLLDTGAPEGLVLAEPAFNAIEKKPERYWIADSLGGVSAGGLGQANKVFSKQLSKVNFDGYLQKNVRVTTRPVVPSLLGYEFFANNTLSFDYANGKLWVESIAGKQSQTEHRTRRIGFTADGGAVVISYLNRSLVKEHPSLALGEQVTHINGRELNSIEDECALFDFLYEVNMGDAELRFSTQSSDYQIEI